MWHCTGKAIFDVDGLAVGNKTVAVTYWGDDRYDANFTTGQFEVRKISSTVDADSKNIKVGKDENIKITVPDDATGRVIVTIDGVDYSGEIRNGRVTIPVSNLPAGEYTAIVTYYGDDKYLPSTTTTRFEVTKSKAPNTASGDYIEIGNDGTVTVNLPEDATGTVTITVDGKKFTSKVVNGKAIFKIPGLNQGDHKVEVYYSGDDKYDANKTETDIVVDDNTPHPHGGDHGSNNDEGIALSTYETGNPILVLLLILLTVGTTQLRRFRK